MPLNLTVLYTCLKVNIAGSADDIAAHSVPSGPPVVVEWQESYTAGAS